MFKIGNVEIKNKVVLAPLAGYTNMAYRMIMKEAGAGMMVSEMISAKGLLYENDKTWTLTQIHETEHPISLQLFGGEIEDLVKAAKEIDKKTTCDFIDINMGCPVRKVLKADAGSMLLQNPEKIRNMVGAVVKAVKKPVTVKIRAGWDHQHINVVEVAKAIEDAGASAIAIHGRTKSDLYSGKVNLDWIKMAKDAVKIPVIGNGDIKTIADAIKMVEYTNVDAVMIGRGSFGNPWLIRDLVDYFSGNPIQNPPTKEEKLAMCKKHFEMLLELKGEKLAILEMRSLASWYIKGIDNSKEFKQKLVHISKKEELFDALEQLLHQS